MVSRTPKAEKKRIILDKEIRTIVVDGALMGVGAEMLEIVPLTDTPRVVEGKVITDQVGNTKLVLTKDAAKKIRESIDKWLKKVEKK